MDLETARQQVMSMQGVNPVDFSMQAKQYWEPVVKPLIEEGGQRFSDYFSALPNILNAQNGTQQVDPAYAARQAMAQVGRLGGLYDQNLGLRDYYNTRSENLGNLALQGYNTQYGNAKDVYSMLFQEKQAADQLALQRQSLAAQYDSSNMLAQYLDKLGFKDTTPKYNFAQTVPTAINNAATAARGGAGGAQQALNIALGLLNRPQVNF